MQFVYWLKILAAVFITNSHFHHVWPIASMAFGGHLGNNLYFILSGFLLYRVKDTFPKWYGKRILRIFPAVWITNIIYLYVGYFRVSDFRSFVYYFIYPTGFHFVGSIMILYILLYIVRSVQEKSRIPTQYFIIAVFLVFITLYVFTFDKSSYHIDDVGEKWVMFMFTESMLFGLWFREKYDEINGKIKSWNVISVVVLLGGYFVGKKVFTGIPSAAPFQCFQPMIVIALTASMMYLFIKLEKHGVFNNTNDRLRRLIVWITAMTLEIYLGQDIIVSHFYNLTFPASFFVVTSSILVYSVLVHKGADLVQKGILKVFNSI